MKKMVRLGVNEVYSFFQREAMSRGGVQGEKERERES